MLCSCCLLWIRVSLARIELLPFVPLRKIKIILISNLNGTLDVFHLLELLLTTSSQQELTLFVYQNGGTNCPACRGVATVAMPFRAIQPLIDTLLRTAPHKARAERERAQADEVYKAGQTIRVRYRAMHTVNRCFVSLIIHVCFVDPPSTGSVSTPGREQKHRIFAPVPTLSPK